MKIKDILNLFTYVTIGIGQWNYQVLIQVKCLKTKYWYFRQICVGFISE